MVSTTRTTIDPEHHEVDSQVASVLPMDQGHLIAWKARESDGKLQTQKNTTRVWWSLMFVPKHMFHVTHYTYYTYFNK